MKTMTYALLITFLLGCQSGSNDQGNASQAAAVATDTTGRPGASDLHKVEVKSVIQVTKYTYLEVLENGNKQWLAVPSCDVRIGETVYYRGGMLMSQFESKELGKTFDRILFLDKVLKDPNQPPAAQSNPHAQISQGQDPHAAALPGMGSSKDTVRQQVKIDRPTNSTSIADLLKSPKDFEGKRIVIKGKVTKYTSGVMGKNWVHIQDGTDYKGKFEIVITTDAELNVGDIAIFDGPISLNKDLGFGYFFEVLMENATLVR